MANHRRVGLAWHKDPEVLERLRVVEPLHIRRVPNVAIARQLGVSENTIREDVKRLQTLWRARIQGEQEVLRAQVVAELDDVAERAMAAAEWDQQAEQAVLYGVEVEIDGQPRQVYRDMKGAAQFRGQKAAALAVVRAARMDKAKVLGIVVEKAALTDADGASLDFVALARQLHGGG
jgi:DNA-binding Lrp family transcriptional regulator